jgi:hypothetical protein
MFSYQSTKGGRVIIYWRGKPVVFLRGQKAEQLLTKLARGDEQLLLAKATGNFKRS